MIPPAQAGQQEIVERPILEVPKDAEVVDMVDMLQESQITEVLQKLDQELVGLQSVKKRITEIAALLLETGRGCARPTASLPEEEKSLKST